MLGTFRQFLRQKQTAFQRLMKPCNKLQGRMLVIAKIHNHFQSFHFLLLLAFALVIYCTAPLSAKKNVFFVSGKLAERTKHIYLKFYISENWRNVHSENWRNSYMLGKLAECPFGKLAECPKPFFGHTKKIFCGGGGGSCLPLWSLLLQ